MKVDLTTASTITQVYDKVNSVKQKDRKYDKRITKKNLQISNAVFKLEINMGLMSLKEYILHMNHLIEIMLIVYINLSQISIFPKDSKKNKFPNQT